MRGCFRVIRVARLDTASVGLGRFQVIERVPNAFTPCDRGAPVTSVSSFYKNCMMREVSMAIFELLVIAMLTVWAVAICVRCALVVRSLRRVARQNPRRHAAAFPTLPKPWAGTAATIRGPQR